MIFTQLSQVDPVDALATCAATPAACLAFTSTLVNLTLMPQTDRRVIALIGQAMARGPEGGTNQFYASPVAIDAIRFHTDADPDFAAETLLTALNVVMRDGVTAQASDGPNGFFKHVIDGLEAQLLFRASPGVTTDFRGRAVAALQQLASLRGLSSAVQQATNVLTEIGEPVTVPTPSETSSTTPASTTDSSSNATTPASASPITPVKTSPKTIALVAGFGVVAIAGIAILIGINMRSAPGPALGGGRLRRKAEAGLRGRNDRSRDL